MTLGQLRETLNLTIKKDDYNKIITFLGCLTVYTENSQINLSLNGPSSTGKSYIALEIAKLFPVEDVIKLGNCSKMAFFHEQGSYDKERNVIVIDFARKLLIFTDAPRTDLLESIRSFLSHDEKIMVSKITDKNQKGGNQTKTVEMKGFPVVVFCSAGLRMDEQEQTRFILLSPETDQEKIRAGITHTAMKQSEYSNYANIVATNDARNELKERIRAIKEEKIEDVLVPQWKLIENFFNTRPRVQSRYQRDVFRLISITKAVALLNLWSHERVGKDIVATESDIAVAIELWKKIAISQELHIPPYLLEIYRKVIYPIWKKKNNDPSKIVGITRREIDEGIKDSFGAAISSYRLRLEILPELENAGLIESRKDDADARRSTVICLFNPENI